MHPVTLTAIVIELIILGAQGMLYLGAPHDRTRLGYLILLLLLLIFNTANGLLPDPHFRVPAYMQHIIVNTSGFMILSYFPFYFYRVLGLEKLRFLAVYGVPLFLLLPYLIFFVVGLSVNEDIAFAHRYGYIIPTAYSLVLLVGIGRAIRFAYRGQRNKKQYIEEIAAYVAIMPWAALAPVVYFRAGQLTETFFTNLGFLALSCLLLYRSIITSRAEQKLIAELEVIPFNTEVVSRNCNRFGLSNRETEITLLICQRMRYKDIANCLFISERTVSKHMQNIFGKTLVNSRSELMRKMNGL